ncbi:LysR family transcriptional regulator [Paenibacillus durus]|uniref:HTH lysR-type domain-containing protein n=1 Tax=Paenibacillus durus ATCC 35681 TaxID=1333534 RepID=A0A0F7F8B8_PAEDU|nr:LysR family transcriptional regulator [Paenibacillus durus]AKG34348.1 hypothetical protein VK70_06985 [Paenibacillus durus ATCC 35681]
MDTLGIEAFLSIVRHGSLTDAASSLFISQSTLSHRLAQLEREVGMSLIDRGRGLRTLSLTSSGQEFLALARRWEALIQETSQIRTRTKNLTLSIGAADSIQTYVLPAIYKELSKYSKEIEIRIRTQQSTELYQLLERGEIDIAFANLEQPMPNMLVKKFLTEQMIVISKGKLPVANNTLIDHELDTSNQLFFEWNPSFRAWYDRWIGDRNYPPIRLDAASLIETFMDCPEKWAIVPMSLARRYEQTGEFFIYQLESPPPERVCYQIQPRNPRSSAVESLRILDTCIHAVMD